MFVAPKVEDPDPGAAEARGAVGSEPAGADDGEGAGSEERHRVLARQFGGEDRQRRHERKSRSLRSSRARRRRRNGADNGDGAGPADPNALRLPRTPDSVIARNEPSRNPTLGGPSPGVLSEAVRNVQKYSQGESLQNVQGSGNFGPSIQFDTKGVDFGPWLRRFVAQIRRNWFVPYAAMSLRGHVVLSFKVHRDGSITDLQIMQPSEIDAFTKSAFNAIKLTNPTVPLPLEFPDENAPFIVTFYFNETPPSGGGAA